MDVEIRSNGSRASRSAVMLATACAGLLVMFVVGSDMAMSSREVTTVAALALLASLPLVDSVMFGSSVSPETAGATFGLSLGFFLRQSMISDQLAAGADRLLMTAFAVSLVLAGWRWFRMRHSA